MTEKNLVKNDLTLHISPAVDIAQNDKGITLYADMPGIDIKSLDIEVENNEVRFSGKLDENRVVGTVKQGRKWDGYKRTFRIPPEINSDAIVAEYNHGVLKLHLPKAEKAQPKKIKLIEST